MEDIEVTGIWRWAWDWAFGSDELQTFSFHRYITGFLASLLMDWKS